MKNLAKTLPCLLIAALLALVPPRLYAGEVLEAAPSAPNASAKFLFYMHGRNIERRGASSAHRYDAVRKALADKGLMVIGEVRSDTNPRAYSGKIAEQIEGLLSAGVPAKNITIAGFSRGGFMTMLIANRLQNRNLKFAVLAGCGLKGTEYRRSYERFIKRGAKKMRGRFFVAWDAGDDKAGKCDVAMDKARVDYRNLELKTGRGHELFFKPDAVWLDPLAAFALAD